MRADLAASCNAATPVLFLGLPFWLLLPMLLPLSEAVLCACLRLLPEPMASGMPWTRPSCIAVVLGSMPLLTLKSRTMRKALAAAASFASSRLW